jgi:hypothetical protein
MTPSTATNAILIRQPPWRGVAGPRVLLIPIVLLAVRVLRQIVDNLLVKHAFNVMINDTKVLSAPAAITDDRRPSRPRRPYSAFWRTEPRVIDTSLPTRTRHSAPAISPAAVWEERGVAGASRAKIPCTSSSTRDARPLRGYQ